MAGLRIEGNTSGNVAEVDSSGNLQVNTPTDEALAGFICVAAESDAGNVVGTRTVRALEATEDYRLRVGLDSIMFNDCFAGAAINTSIWDGYANTMTIALSTGYCVLNANSTITGNADCTLNTYRTFPVLGAYGTYAEMLVSFSQVPQANNICEWGLGLAANRSTPTDGAYFRIASDQTVICVLNNGGTETPSTAISFASLIGANINRHYIVNLTDDAAEFWIDDVKVARIVRPNTWSAITSSCSMPMFFRNYNVGQVATAQQLKVGMCTASLADMQNGKPWSHIMAGTGMCCYQGATGMAVGQTTQLALNTNPATATLTANTAALGTGLGGIFDGYITSLAATQNYIISSYQVPAGTATVPGRTLYITGFKLDTVNTGATNAASPLTWAIGLHFGCTAVDPSTAESATAKNSRRLVCGVQSLASSAVVGTMASPSVSADFSQGPIVVNSGEYIQSFIRFINYTSTASQSLFFYVTFIGYWE